MSLVSCTFAIADDASTALEGVVVRIYSEDGLTFVTQGTTDEDGELVLDLEDLTTYWVRFFLIGYQFDSKLLIDVDSGASSNTFDVEAVDLNARPQSTVSYLCRASGFVRGPDLTPLPGVELRVMVTGRPRVVHGEVALGSSMTAVSDDDGWLEVDLIQGASYDVIVTGQHDTVLRVQVPETQAVSLVELLWPYIVSFTYLSGSTAVTSLALDVEEEAELSLELLLSSGVTVPYERDDKTVTHVVQYLAWSSSDESVARVEFGEDDVVRITGLATGVTTVTAEVTWPDEASRFPEPTRSLATLTITVT